MEEIIKKEVIEYEKIYELNEKDITTLIAENLILVQ